MTTDNGNDREVTFDQTRFYDGRLNLPRQAWAASAHMTYGGITCDGPDSTFITITTFVPCTEYWVGERSRCTSQLHAFRLSFSLSVTFSIRSNLTSPIMWEATKTVQSNSSIFGRHLTCKGCLVSLLTHKEKREMGLASKLVLQADDLEIEWLFGLHLRISMLMLDHNMGWDTFSLGWKGFL